MIRSEGLGFKSSPRYYNRRNIAVSPVFVCGGRPRTAHIYNTPKPSFEKEGLWQDLSCIASQSE